MQPKNQPAKVKNSSSEKASSARIFSRASRFMCMGLVCMAAVVALQLGIAQAKADEPTTVTLPAATVQHVIAFLSTGGTNMERDALSAQVLAEARSDVQKQQAAQAPKPGPTVANPTPTGNTATPEHTK